MRIALLVLLFLPMSLFAEDAPASPEELRKRIAILEAELQTLRTQAIPFKTLAELEVGLSLLRWGENQPANQLPKRLMRFLGLSEAERKALGGIVRATREQLVAEIAKLKPTTEKTTAGYRLVIAEFAADGKILEGTFLKQAGEVLGPDRLRLMRRSMQSLSEKWFLDFGQRTNTYTFTQSGNGWSLRQEAKGDGGTSMSTQGSLSSLDRYALIKPYLPEELVREIEKDVLKQPKPDEVSDF
jgi:hypothetical protein